MAQTLTRLSGSGMTQMTFRGTTLAWLQVIQDTPPVAVAQAQAIQPIDSPTPMEVVTAQAVGAGTCKLSFYELWNGPVWTQLPGFEGAKKLLDVLNAQLGQGDIQMQKIIRGPAGVRTKIYLGVVITEADDGEAAIQINTMSVPKSITFMYRDSA